ncbi:hypothetical protein TNIN_245861 [Trichonephila inaurata madagascariensis]|uniref:Uncharacterized protein n=1 Tax=Trichonephila inaurata madagascariensis TaxID=2747483 RepID=A0A8X7C885_9ARAC|nr:hypothetical protein TNIN_245861 [Trichonephila inaurata madagascariensis]
MSTQYSRQGSTRTPTHTHNPRNEIPLSIRITVDEDEPASSSRNISPSTPLECETSFCSGESRNASLWREAALTPPVGIRYLSLYNRTDSEEFFYRSPYDLDPEIFVPESPDYARRCKSFIKKIRNSKCYRTFFYTTLLLTSLRIMQLLWKYLPNCVENMELIYSTILMGVFSFVGSFQRLAALVIRRFATRYNDFVPWIFLFSFGLATIAELIIMAVIIKKTPCKPFVHAMAYVNYGIFFLAILSSLVHLDVLIVLLHPSHPESLYNFMRSLCNCCRG